MTDEEAQQASATAYAWLTEACRLMTQLSQEGHHVEFEMTETNIQTMTDHHPVILFNPKLTVAKRQFSSGI